MSGINRNLEPDIRHIAKHLPDTLQMQRLLQEEGAAHVFNNLETLQTVAQAIDAIGANSSAIFAATNVMDSTFLSRSGIELT